MNCRHCGSDNTESQGRNMRCRDCGRASAKIVRCATISAKDRPSCPECGSPNPYRDGMRNGRRKWSCRSCGRFYTSPPEIDKAELTESKYCTEVQVE